MDRPLVIPPPIPAPYLANTPPLPDDVLNLLDQRRRSPRERRYVEQALANRRSAIRAARTAYEAAHHVRIASEVLHFS